MSGLSLSCRTILPGLAVALGSLAAPLHAQPRYPERPVRVVIPFAPGGNTDLMGRRFGARLTPLLGQTIVIDNRAGAGGNIGAAEVARARPDGYTLLIGTSSTHALNPLTFEDMPYDPVKDFAPVAVLGISHMVIAVHPTIAGSLRDLVAKVKAQPGRYSYGSSGLRTNVHLTGEMFIRQAGGLDLLHVPYKGGGQAVQETIAGQIPVVITAISSATPYHRAGRLRILAVFSEARSKALPEVPTAIESGVPGMLSSSLNVLFGPAGTPRAIVDVLHQATVKIVADAAFQADLDTLGMDPVTDATPERTAQLIKDEIARWTPVVQAAGMAPGRSGRAAR
jgi:tripartite-type tricarboxylate transporter receptor subunit TctC